MVILFALVFITWGFFSYQKNNQTQGIVRAYGKLVVTFPSSPMFQEENWLPGKTITKSIRVENTDFQTQKVGIKATSIFNTASSSLPAAIGIIILQGNTPLYGEGSPTGPRNLAEFFSEEVVWLGELERNKSSVYLLRLQMIEEAGNEYQNLSTGFDLFLGTDIISFRALPTLPPIPTIRKIPTLKPLPTFPPLSPVNR